MNTNLGSTPSDDALNFMQSVLRNKFRERLREFNDSKIPVIREPKRSTKKLLSILGGKPVYSYLLNGSQREQIDMLEKRAGDLYDLCHMKSILN